MPDLTEHYQFRDDLAHRLSLDLLGPVGQADETLVEEPATAYITGVLYPAARDETSADEQRREKDVDLTSARMTTDEVPDTGVSMANRQMPSAMGLTFAVDPQIAPEVRILVKAAKYVPIDESGNPVAARRAERRGSDSSEELRWQRRTLPINPVHIKTDRPETREEKLAEGLELIVRVREPDDAGVVAITATLINRRTAGRQEIQDVHCFFQPELRAEVPGGVPGLVERGSQTMSGVSAPAESDDHDELLVTRLLHRHAPTFATGHGCAAAWAWAAPPPRGARPASPAGTDAVWTSFVPSHEVLLTDSNPDVDELVMLELAEASTEEVLTRLDALVAAYDEWITGRQHDAMALYGTEFGGTARDQIRGCRDAAARMRNGVKRLRDDDVVLTAFRLANRAMAEQRARSAWMREGSAGEPDLAAGRWRPFQIGFLLLCLDGIVDDGHDDRAIADVLWFPTGGGKTEAYLGLIAFTTFLRRLRDGDRGGGVTVLMRYTLRLLTLQQFERAATLICAMETMRQRRSESLGSETISIGMWVGRAATPNRLDEAEKGLEELRKGRTLHEQNPVQLHSCPWCGTVMDYQDYRVNSESATMIITCRNNGCAFRAGLPVHVVDDDIYAVRPTLIIATADKFAQIAWRGQVAKLFNREGALEGTKPPELVIQDELHLISGPLGTLAGLYETAIDLAADQPKIIASTATIRRAQQQGRQLFDRAVRQFPPAGLDARDSWFAVEAGREVKATRRYVGVFTPSTSQASLLIRTYSALLHHVALIEGADRVRDTYWTLVGYFNSLRLLSAAELQVHADVAERLKQLAVRDGVTAREVANLTELTSRVESSEIPRYLKDLFRSLPAKATIDAVLATNMISVGVDVDRLGLMAVMGQPQTTAEYIQATSRVGRRDPGLVVTMLNAARSRDRSHYENFTAYHSALYRQVESTSVTPFAARARDRALHAVLVGLTRVLHPVARPNDAAAKIEDFLDEVYALRAKILERVADVAHAEHERTDRELVDFIEKWRDLAAVNPQLRYEAERRKWAGQPRATDAALMASYGQDEDLAGATPTMWSLRDVDVDSHLYLER